MRSATRSAFHRRRSAFHRRGFITIVTSLLVATSMVGGHVAHASAGRDTGAHVVRSYPCMQGDPVSAPAGLAPGAPPPDSFIQGLRAALLHANGLTCYVIGDGTRDQQIALAQQLTVQPVQQTSNAATPLTNGQCNNSGDQYVPAQENPYAGVVINLSIHYRLNIDCTHTFYNTAYSFAPGSNTSSTWLDTTQICSTNGSPCTPSTSLGCANIPVTVQYGSSGLGDNDQQKWTSTDYYGGDKFLGDCSPVYPKTATFSVRTS